MRVAVALVHYHAAALTQEALVALRQDAESAALAVEWWIVDNGSAPEERTLLESLPAKCTATSNRGYAGAINLVVRETGCPYLVVLNPDVVVSRGCLPRLLSELADGAAVAGPRLYWDRQRRFLLPPTERRTPVDEVLGVLASGASGRLAAAGRRRWRRHARRFWAADRALPCFELSGAMLALRRDAWERVGPFDEGYRLYFEETDWLLRLRRQGLRASYVPAAEAVHLYARSSRSEPRAAGWFRASERRFRSRHYGPLVRSLLLVASAWGRRARSSRPFSPQGGAAPSGESWLEVAESPRGYPAAARRLEGGEPPPSGLPASADRDRPYWLRWVDDSGRDLAVWEAPAGTAARPRA